MSMILGYGILGLFLSTIGGAAPGASNIAVIRTSVKESINKGMHIALGAGVGEVLLAFMALCYSTMLLNFFEMHTWIQVAFISLLFVIGVLFIISERLKFINIPRGIKQKSNSKFVTGFILAFLNPPVLFFWILGISLSQKYLLPLTDMSPTTILTIFFIGVFLGKVLVLYLYARLGKGLEQKQKTDNSKMNRIIGIVLIALSLAQAGRFLIQ